VLETEEERNKVNAWDCACSLMKYAEFRERFNIQKYFDLKRLSPKELEKASWLLTLCCFYSEMIIDIIYPILDILQELFKLEYSSNVRSNAVLAISLLTYQPTIFDILLGLNIIDKILELCKDNDVQVKQYASLALVHFSINKKSINILIEKGVMNLFNQFSVKNGSIQTNVSWIFLSLCNNGITGKTMLENGITRDMFLVSCNPQFD
jgi:hypothetical protein